MREVGGERGQRVTRPPWKRRPVDKSSRARQRQVPAQGGRRGGDQESEPERDAAKPGGKKMEGHREAEELGKDTK